MRSTRACATERRPGRARSGSPHRTRESFAGNTLRGVELRARIRGSLLAGAVGDALGAPVEFLTLEEIHARLGPAGVTGHLPAYGRAGGAITDDTQMTLFTAEGVIRALVRGSHRGIVHIPSVLHRAYLRWLVTQGETSGTQHGPPGWLIGVEDLHARRAPGSTCLAALRSGVAGTIAKPINDSKGCGGAMRIAPIGFAEQRRPFTMAAEAAATTHGHPTGYLAAGFLAQLIARILEGAALEAALDDATAELRSRDGHEETLAAVTAARSDPGDVEALGAGWVAEEALAISIHCALAAPDLRSALLLAVNHSGDSDSTGSITGQILGALHGEAAIPPEWLEPLELRDVIARVADDVHDAFHGEGVGGEHQPYDARVREWLDRYPGT